jgi:RHS repeat-associated protein
VETVVDDRDELEWPVTHRTRNTTITHDSLYRVMSVDYSYNLGSGSTGTDASSDWRSEAAPINTNDPGDRTARAGARSATSTRRTRHPAPADLVGALPSTRVVNLDYEWDWLGNEVSRLDDAWSFYERSLGTLTSGNDANASAPRPSALYLATNIDDVGGVESTWDGAGWVEVQYGVSGNVTSFTVHGECHDVSSGSCVDDPTDTLATRIASLRTQCSCATEQHYSFRWDELNRLVDGRRYDRNSTTSGAWVHGARLRYRYDGANQRTVKEVLTDPTTGGGGDGGFGVGVGGGGGGWTTSERVTLFVYPGDYERRGLTRTWSGYQAITTGTDATETQYLVAGARIVWDSAGDGLLPPIDRNRRATINVTDLLGTTGAVVDLLSGDLVEVSTYYPNGARENLWTNDALVPLEPMGFTTKEADEEIGVTYFGERWLIPRLGRWATPDPLHVHASGGGEALNSYHYVSGNILQAVDPLGLQEAEAGHSQYGALGLPSPRESLGERWSRGFREVGEGLSWLALEAAGLWDSESTEGPNPHQSGTSVWQPQTRDRLTRLGSIAREAPPAQARAVVDSASDIVDGTADAADYVTVTLTVVGVALSMRSGRVRPGAPADTALAEAGVTRVRPGSGVIIGRHGNMTTFLRGQGARGAVQSHHLLQDAAFGVNGGVRVRGGSVVHIGRSDGLAIALTGNPNVRGSGHWAVHVELEIMWDQARRTGRGTTPPTVAQYNAALRRGLSRPETGLVPSEVNEVMARVLEEQQIRGIRPTDRFREIPNPTRTAH